MIVAGGHGAFEPRRLPTSDVDIAPWEGRGAHYLVGDKTEFAGRRVVIVGGGDSAFDWVVNLLDTAARVTLVHRREGFRAHEATVAEVMEHVDAGRVDLRVPVRDPARPRRRRDRGGRAAPRGDRRRRDARVRRGAAPARLRQPSSGPLQDWGFAIEKDSLVVDPLMRTNLDRVWACGDITTFDGKLKLIATGFAEAAIAVVAGRPPHPPRDEIQPAYSTNTGVPGVVAGQH